MTHPSSRCIECPLFTQLRKSYTPARLIKDAEMIFVGDIPSGQDKEFVEPFRSKAGSRIDYQRYKAKIKRSDVSDTNILKCRPEKNDFMYSNDLKLAVDCCSEILEKDIKGTKVVVGLGELPLKVFTNNSGLLQRRGSIYQIDVDQYFIGTIHPINIVQKFFVGLKKKDKAWFPPEEIVIADLVKAKTILEKDFELPKPNFILYPTDIDLSNALKLMENEETIVGMDIETNIAARLELAFPSIISISFGMDLTICVDFVDDTEWLIEALASPCRKVFHNGCFDVFVNENMGFEVNNYWFDTLYAHHLMYAELMHKLGFVQSLYTNLPYHKDMANVFEQEMDK